LWDRYTELYPDADLVYTIGVSDYRRDWFYAQVPRSVSLNINYLHNMAEDYILLTYEADSDRTRHTHRHVDTAIVKNTGHRTHTYYG